MTQQLQDAPELLEQMIEDQLQAKAVYQTSNVWDVVGKNTIAFLRENGLDDLRSRTDCWGFQGFGATDPSPMHNPLLAVANTPNLTPEFTQHYSSMLLQLQELPNHAFFPFGLSLADIYESAFRMAELYGQLNGAAPLKDLEISMVGTPRLPLEVNGKNYTYVFLSYYMRYAYCCKFIDFSKVDAIVEIGCGAGKFAEVLKQAHPHLSFYLLEIAPQNYVCHQYLKGVFGDDAVLDYSEHRNSKSIKAPAGKFAVLGNWQVEHIKPKGRVLFVNTASFQEMEPHIVENYLNFVKPYSQAMYLLQSVSGVPQKTDAAYLGEGATEPMVMAHYQKFLQPQFELISQEIAYDPLKAIKDIASNYDNMMWVNQQKCEILKPKI
jgi:putative sugar O-methyltransferase